MEGQELLQTSFEATKLMSTYVLALAVCDFAFREARLADNTLVGAAHTLHTLYTHTHTQQNPLLLLAGGLWCAYSAPCWGPRTGSG